jgi:uncharacterized membrane protein HdeD (DUF308 family)
MLSDIVAHAYRRTQWALIVRGLLGIALGVFILMRPLESVAALALVVAIWALADGFAEIATALEVRESMAHWWVMLLAGIVNLGFGVAALYYYPGLSLAFAVIWVAYWLLIGGVLALWAAFHARQLQLPWGWGAVWGTIAVIGGIYAIMSPSATLAALLTLIAVMGIFGGVARLVAAFRLSSLKSSVRSAVSA